MVEGYAMRMERLMGQAERVARRGPVGRVADHGVSDRREVDANLVGSPGLEMDRQQRMLGKRLDELEVRGR